jgi:hypothetical protein
MYGLVNKAIRDLVVQQFGTAAWQRITEAAGLAEFADGAFLSMEPYSDEITYRLVGAAAKTLGKEVPELLEHFGDFWIRFTASEGYGELMDLFGNSFEEFLGNLDSMHVRVGLSMSELRPPGFTFEPGKNGVHKLHYWSERAGLAPMVTGLLKGLATRFRVDVEVSHQPRGEHRDHDVFLISRRAR